MRYVAAYVLAVMGGNQNPDVAALKKILSSVGVDCDEKKASMVVDACKGKKVEDLMSKGTAKLASVPTGSAAAPAAAGGAAPADKKETAAAAKKEEEEEEDEDMGFGLFD